MYNKLSTLRMQGSVSSIKIVDDKIYVIDNKYNLSIYSNETFEIIERLSLIKDSTERHVYDKSYAISSNLDFYASLPDSNSGNLFYLKDIHVIKKSSLSFHEETISYAKFSNNSELLAIGADDGVVYFYNLDYEKAILSFSPRSDAISSISFSKNDKHVSVGSFDKSITLYDIESNSEVVNVSLSDVPEDVIFLNNKFKVAGITRDKKLFIYDNAEGSLNYLESSFDEWPTKIEKIGSNHLLVSTRSDTLYLIKIDELEISKEIKLDSIGVKTLLFNNGRVYLGYINGEIEIIDTMYLHDEFELNLKLTNYDIATSLMDKNIFLLATENIKTYDKAWEQVLDIAKDYILAKDIEASLKIAKPFFFDKKKLREYNFINSNKEVLLQFSKLVENNKDIMAFKLAEEKTYLKDTKEYETIETRWQKVYQVCKMMFEKDDATASQRAIDTLKKYLVIASKKEGVNNLITNYKDFIKVYKLIKARNFRLYFILVEKKPFLAKEDLYEKVNKIGNQTYTKLIGLEQNEEFEQVKKISQTLKHFTKFKDKVNMTIERVKQKEQLQEFVKNDDLEAIYDIVYKNNELEDLLAFIEYHKGFESAKKSALDTAKNGQTDMTYHILEKYLNVDYLIHNIASIFKLSYISEMENEAKTNFMLVDWEKTIDNYMTLFGLDNELSLFLKSNAEIYSMQETNNNDDNKGYLKKDFYDSIVIHK